MKQVRRFYALAFGLTWGIGAIALLGGRWMPTVQPLSPSNPLYYVAAYAVSLSGIFLTWRYSGREGLSGLGRRLIPRRSSLRWILMVVAGYGVITGIVLWISGRARGAALVLPDWSTLLSAGMLTIVRDPGPLGEEFGWRGFALPRLLERYSPLRASIGLGLVHAAWHVPLFFIPGMPQAQLSFPLFTVGVVAIAIFDTALYLRTEASLLLAIVVHVLANWCGGLAADAQALHFFLAAEGVVAALIVGFRRRCFGTEHADGGRNT
jgi:CAAX protease family protein